MFEIINDMENLYSTDNIESGMIWDSCMDILLNQGYSELLI